MLFLLIFGRFAWKSSGLQIILEMLTVKLFEKFGPGSLTRHLQEVVRRVGSKLDPAGGTCLPYDIICLHLEKAALDRLSSGEELIGDEDAARSLLGACKGLPEAVLPVCDQLLSNGTIVPSLNLKLLLLRSVLAILHEWGMTVIAHKLGTTTAGASFFLDGTFSLNQTVSLNQGVRDKTISLANRYEDTQQEDHGVPGHGGWRQTP